MIHSKAIKGLPKRFGSGKEEKPTTAVGKALSFISSKFKEYVYWPIDSFISRTSERIGRSYAFAKHAWLHYDFESAYLYDIMAFKLKRIHAALKTGCAVQSKEDMDALKEAIKICERLFNERYEDKYYNAIDKKWGKLKSDRKKGDESLTWSMKRTKVKTKRHEKQERKEILEAHHLAQADRNADLDSLNRILKKHQQTWWD